MAFFKGEDQLRKEGRQAADSVEIRFSGSKGGQRRKGAVLMRTRGEQRGRYPRAGGRGAVDLLVELCDVGKGRKLPEKAPLLTTYWGRAGGKCGREGRRRSA